MNWKLNSHKIEYVTTMIFIKSKNIFQNYKSIQIHFQEWNKNSFNIYETRTHSWTWTWTPMRVLMNTWTRLCSYEHVYVLMNTFLWMFLWTRLCSYEHMALVHKNKVQFIKILRRRKCRSFRSSRHRTPFLLILNPPFRVILTKITDLTKIVNHL